MSIFISFNFATGNEVAHKIAKELLHHRLDPWWFPDPLPEDQISNVVETALGNCQSCILVWSRKLTEWQTIEVATIRQILGQRAPAGDPTDMFLIFRNSEDEYIRKQKTLPLLQHSEYIDYRESDVVIPNLSHLANYIPSVESLIYANNRRPHFNKMEDFRPESGRHVLAGGFIEESKNENIPSRHCWVLLEDVHGNLYIQQPRPTITHYFRWIMSNIQIGPNISGVILCAVGPKAHALFVEKVLRRNFGAIYKTELPDDYEEVDRLTFPPTS